LNSESVNRIRNETIAMVWQYNKNGYNTNTEKALELKFKRNKSYGTTQNKMVQSGIGRQQGEKKELTRN
jgi:hypothetical protein